MKFISYREKFILSPSFMKGYTSISLETPNTSIYSKDDSELDSDDDLPDIPYQPIFNNNEQDAGHCDSDDEGFGCGNDSDSGGSGGPSDDGGGGDWGGDWGGDGEVNMMR